MSDSNPKAQAPVDSPSGQTGAARSDGAEFDWLARIDPGFDQARRALAARVWFPEAPALAVKYREIIAAVILGCRSYPSIASHLRRALQEGASLREILEGFETAAILGGFPALHYALPVLIELHTEFGDAALNRAGTEATSVAAGMLPAGMSAPAAITQPVSRGMREWAWLDAVDPGYDAARRRITAFAWTPSAPALPIKIRELVASAVLAYRAFPTIDGHLRRAVREGASVRELLEAMETAALPGGFPVLHYALPFVQAIHDEIENGSFK